MKSLFLIILSSLLWLTPPPDAADILRKVDENMTSRNRIFESEMVIYGRRGSRTIASKSWSEGDDQSLTEYLAPAREKGTKMLKLEDRLWIYSPSSDRSIQLSGHMLRQSVMGSDLSYEDMMEDRKLTEIYDAKVVGEESMQERSCYVLELSAKVEDVAYFRRKIWVDQSRFVPLKEELYAKSGQLLKQTELSEVVQVQGRWFPKKVRYKDMLKDGKGTEFIVTSIQFDQEIPAHIFSKASLKK
ncbi:MAG: outer membrane lipoprotein-sorting protein [Bacteroidota bacterium]